MNIQHRSGRTITLLFPCAFMAGCINTSAPNFQPKQLPAIGDEKGTYFDVQGKEITWFNAEIQRFVDLNSLVSNGESTPAYRRAFVEAGLNVSDQVANRWFREQFALDAQSRYNNNTFNVITGGLTALFGITDASAKAVSLLGAATSVTNAQWKNYEASYLLSSALPLVLEKLREFRKVRRNEIIARYNGDAVPGYYEAVDELRNYHQTASREVIKRFIEKSAELAEFTTKLDQDGGAKGIQVLPLNTALFTLFYPRTAGTFSKNELITIYALVSQAKTSNLVAAISGTTTGKHLFELVERICGEPDGKGDLMKLISALNSLLALEEEVRKQQKVVDAAAKAAEAAKIAAGVQAEKGPADPTKTPNPAATDELDQLADAARKAQVIATAEVAKLAMAKEAAEDAAKEHKTKSAEATRLAATVTVTSESVATLSSRLTEAQKALEAAKQTEAGLRQESELARKAAESLGRAFTLAANDLESAWEWTGSKTKKATIAKDASEKAKDADAIAMTKRIAAASAAEALKSAISTERELADLLGKTERELREAKITATAKAVESERAQQTARNYESVVAIHLDAAAKANKAVEDLRATEAAKRLKFSEQAAAAAAAKAAPLVQALETRLDPPGSSQPRVQSVK